MLAGGKRARISRASPACTRMFRSECSSTCAEQFGDTVDERFASNESDVWIGHGRVDAPDARPRQIQFPDGRRERDRIKQGRRIDQPFGRHLQLAAQVAVKAGVPVQRVKAFPLRRPYSVLACSFRRNSRAACRLDRSFPRRSRRLRVWLAAEMTVSRGARIDWTVELQCLANAAWRQLHRLHQYAFKLSFIDFAGAVQISV